MKIGALFAGYGGLEMGMRAVLGGDLAWYSEIDKGALKILTHRHPDVPNVGDVTTADWSQVEPVDILTGGFPCQPVSFVGSRAGTKDKRWLFDEILRAIGELVTPPRLCLFENVPGLLSANDGDAMGRVVQGLAAIGYVGRWRTVRASDVGAPHQRARVFIVAHPEGERHERDWAARSRRARSPDSGVAASNPPGQPGRVGDGDDEGPWGSYWPAVRRWEELTRPAPDPMEPAPRGGQRLSPAAVEWMMGLPAGWVTDVPGITRNEALKALGNGVVPQQAAAALRVLLPLAVAA